MHVWNIIKLLEYMESLCDVAPIFICFSCQASSVSAYMLYLLFPSLSYLLKYYPCQLRQKLILNQTFLSPYLFISSSSRYSLYIAWTDFRAFSGQWSLWTLFRYLETKSNDNFKIRLIDYWMNRLYMLRNM